MIHHIRAVAMFAKVAETRSFRAAASALRVSPSVVSQQIRTLEEALGVALIYRSTRALALTPQGEALLGRAQAMVAEMEAGLALVSDNAVDPVGELRIAAPEALTRSPFIDAVASFSETWPGIRLKLSFTDQRIDVVSGGFDLSIRVGWLDDSALKARKIATVPRVLVASPELVARRGRPTRPSDLADWDFIRFTQNRGGYALTKPGESPTELRPTPRIESTNAIGAYQLALRGAGYASSTRFLAAGDIASGAMVELLPDWRLTPAGVYAVWPPNAPKGSVALRFVDHFERRISDAPGALQPVARP